MVPYLCICAYIASPGTCIFGCFVTSIGQMYCIHTIHAEKSWAKYQPWRDKECPTQQEDLQFALETVSRVWYLGCPKLPLKDRSRTAKRQFAGTQGFISSTKAVLFRGKVPPLRLFGKAPIFSHGLLCWTR